MKTRKYNEKSPINKFSEVQLSIKKANKVIGGGNSQAFGGWIPAIQGNSGNGRP